MADKVRFYIVDTPFGYIVSTKRIVFKEERDVEQFKKMLEAREILCQIKKQTES